MGWIMDQIPVWGWVVIIGVPALAAFYFASPVLIPLWNLTPRWLKVLLGAIGAGFLLYRGGAYQARKRAEEEQRRRNAEALRKRQEVENETSKMSGSEVDKKLRDRWSRRDDT